MTKHFFKKLILTSSIAIMGLGAVNTTISPIVGSQAQAVHIQNDEQNHDKLKSYYTQEPKIYTNRYLQYSKHDGYFIRLPHISWLVYVNLTSQSSLQNVFKLKYAYVDVFGLEDKPTAQYNLFSFADFNTGGITPAAKEGAKEWSLSSTTYLDDLKIHEPDETFLKTKKHIITLKELDFWIRKTAIERGLLYQNGLHKGTITINLHNNDKYTIHLDKRLHDNRANDFVETAKIKSVDVKIEN